MTTKIYSRFPPLVLGLCLSLGVSFAHALEYPVKTCCDICPAASLPESYNTRFLKSFLTLVKGQDDWLFRSEVELGHEFGPDAVGYQEFGRLVDALKQRGVELVFVYLPTKGLVHHDKLKTKDRRQFDFELASQNYRKALEKFRAQGAVVPDLTPLLSKSGTQLDYFFRRDHHWSPEGARVTADIVSETIKKLDAYSSVPHQDYVTKRVGMIEKRGTLQIAFDRICHQNYSMQYVDEYASEPVVGGTAGANDEALFGEDDLPAIALLGTSNSKGSDNYNFDGFLKERLASDILNEALAAGGPDGAFIQYLPSEMFQQNPPSILIWEVPGYDALTKRLFYRKVIPLVNNGCASQPALLSSKKTLSIGRNEILFNGGGKVKSLKSGDLVVDLQFSSPDIKELKATVWYINSRSETVKIEYPDRIETGGRFAFELRADQEWKDFKFLSMDIDIEPDGDTARRFKASPLSVSASLCLRHDHEKQGQPYLVGIER